jgi:hypothetical protein
LDDIETAARRIVRLATPTKATRHTARTVHVARCMRRNTTCGSVGDDSMVSTSQVNRWSSVKAKTFNTWCQRRMY